MADVSIRVAAEDGASSVLDNVGRSALLMGDDFDTADGKIADCIKNLRERGLVASTEWAAFSAAYATGWTIRTNAASAGDAVLIALEGARKIRGTTELGEEAANTVLRVKNYFDIAVAAAKLDYASGVYHANSNTRLGLLGGWWTAARDGIVGVIDGGLVPAMGRLAGGLDGLVTSAENMASGVGGAFVRMGNSVFDELGRAQLGRDGFVNGLGVPALGGLGGVVTAAAPRPMAGSAGTGLGSWFGGSAGGFASRSMAFVDHDPDDPNNRYDMDGKLIPRFRTGEYWSDEGGEGVTMGWGYPSDWFHLDPDAPWDQSYGNGRKLGLALPDQELEVRGRERGGTKKFYPDGYKWGWFEGLPHNSPMWLDQIEEGGPDWELDISEWMDLLFPGGPVTPEYKEPYPPWMERASGGPVIAGSSYMVGEKGPERFVATGRSASGSGAGSELNIRTLNLYGVQDGAALFDVVVREARARGTVIA